MKNVNIHAMYLNGKAVAETALERAFRSFSGNRQLRGCVAVILTVLFFFPSISSRAQNCATSGTTVLTTNENTYYPGTQANVAAGSASIVLGPIGSGTNFSNTPIASGDIVLIIQMQGAQFNLPASKTNSLYGANASGISSGMITTGLSAGQMEFAVAANAVPVGGGTLNLASGLTYAYSNAAFGTTGQYTYQIIRVPSHYNIQLGATITTPLWNGSTGGVTVVSAVNQLDLNGKTINASGAGFRGGGGRALSGSSTAVKYDLYELSTETANASKGEGIGGTPRYIFFGGATVNTGAEGYPGGSFARGGVANAGGGAADSRPASNDENAGGGGGGNGGSGGVGGNGWFSFGVTGGFGGTSFMTYGPSTTYYSPGRLILGGGGGAGTTNNASGTPSGGAASSGASGGGLIIINATSLFGTGTLNANGNTGNSTVTVDGSGGGGAGGSILIYANSGHSGITATANGGNGSSNNPSASGATQHGPGGGGGGGVIFSNGTLSGTSSVSQGLAGISTGSTISDNYGASNGTVGSITQTFPFTQLPPKMTICQSTILPVTLLSFSATYASSNNVKVSWTTTNEVNADYFVVERSTDGSSFTDVGQIDASESLNPIHNYTTNDQLYGINASIIYYRLKIVDVDGKVSYSKVIPVKLDQPENSISVYPNPVDNYAILNMFSDKSGSATLRLMDNAGKTILVKSFTVTTGNNSTLIDQLGHLPKGIYIIQVMFNNNLFNQKIIKK